MAGGIMRKLFKTLMLSALVCGCAVIGALAGCAKMYEEIGRASCRERVFITV